MTLAQQTQTLQSRGLIIADTTKAEQALDAISYFRLADYWYYLEADHHTHQFLPNSLFEEVLTCYYFDKALKVLLFKSYSDNRSGCQVESNQTLCPYMWSILVYGCDESRKPKTLPDKPRNHQERSWAF